MGLKKGKVNMEYNRNYDRAIEISAQYSEEIAKLIDKYNAEIQAIYPNYVPHCFNGLSPQFLVDTPSEGFEPWFERYFKKDVAGTYICEFTSIQTGIPK